MRKLNLPNALLGLLGIILSLISIWYIVTKYDFSKSWTIIKDAPLPLLLIMISVYMATFLLRMHRWKLMLPGTTNFNSKELLKCIVIGFAGNNILPARGGELLRMEYFSRKFEISRTTALSSIGLEKILDGLILLSFILLASLSFSERNVFIYNTIKIALLIFIPATFFLITLRIYGSKIIKRLESSNRLLIYLKPFFENFYQAISFIKIDVNTLLILIVSTMIWLLEGLVFFFGIKSAGYNESIFLSSIIALCIVNFSILIPSSPGYIGIFQIALILALSAFGIPESNSLAAAIIIHSCQFFPVTILGIIIITSEYFDLKKMKNEI